MRSIADHLIRPRRFHLQTCFFQAAFLTFLISSFAVAGKDIVPPSPEKSWSPPGLDQYENDLAHGAFSNEQGVAQISIDPAKIYELPELIDIAERSNPETRIAWEQARQAVGAVGLNQSAYYPYLAASAAAGFQHGSAAFLTEVISGNAAQEDALLNLQWLLFDFGGRNASVTAAKEKLMAANMNFNATHQLIVFAVTKNFYVFNTVRQKVAVMESSLRAAKTVQDAAQARLDNGLGTKPDELQAEQQMAQADYQLESARGDLSDAQVALVESLGILPTTELQIADVPKKTLTADYENSLDDLIQRALSQRPDLVAKLANVRASEAEVKKARADFFPKISLEASGGWSKLDIDGYNGPYVGNSKPTYSVGIGIDLPLFDGFLRANKLRIAKSELRAAQSELTDSRDTVVREVWKAYTDFKTALHKQDSAEKLLTAAQNAFDAALESYRHGLGNYVDVANAQRNLDVARSVIVDTRSEIFTSSAALALSVGDLAKPDRPNNFIRPPK
jgi:outer membrane protein